MHTFKLNKLCSLGLLALSSSVFTHSAFATATQEGTVNNGNGTFTYTQKINATSTLPHYNQSIASPATGGFGFYSGYNQDFGWQHSFGDIITNPLIQIQSATLMIRAYDVDSESFHGTNGEYDGIAVDGVDLNPGLLQGTNNTWSETSFDLPIFSISDDGLINTFMDADMYNISGTMNWVTQLDYSLLTITYLETTNNPPLKPELSMSPSSCDATTASDLVASITGPTPADPDGDSVSYLYRWFVDIGQGSVVDDEVAGKTDHQGNTVLSTQTIDGETWRVQVTAVDSNGLVSDPEFSTWISIDTDCDGDGVDDVYDDYPADPERAFNNYNPSATLVFEDLWPEKGDYDYNDFVMQNVFNTITHASGAVKEVAIAGNAVARGAGYANAFAISFLTDTSNIESSSLTLDGNLSTLTPEAGHTGEAVIVLIDNISSVLPSGTYSFYNTQNGDDRPLVPIEFNVVFETPVPVLTLGDAPFNPFIYRVANRGLEIHMSDRAPTDLADLTLLGTSDDASDPNTNSYYQTANGHPWALYVPSIWTHPYEYIDVLLAYPQMQVWAESGGSTNPGWFAYPDTTHCWKC